MRRRQDLPVWTTDWFTGLDEGVYASWITGAWGAVFIPQLPRKASDTGAPRPCRSGTPANMCRPISAVRRLPSSIRRDIRRKPLSSPCSSVAIRKPPSSGRPSNSVPGHQGVGRRPGDHEPQIRSLWWPRRSTKSSPKAPSTSTYPSNMRRSRIISPARCSRTFGFHQRQGLARRRLRPSAGHRDGLRQRPGAIPSPTSAVPPNRSGFVFRNSKRKIAAHFSGIALGGAPGMPILCRHPASVSGDIPEADAWPVRDRRSGDTLSASASHPIFSLAPFTLLFLAFLIAPMVYAFNLAIYRTTVVAGTKFVGPTISSVRSATRSFGEGHRSPEIRHHPDPRHGGGHTVDCADPR